MARSRSRRRSCSRSKIRRKGYTTRRGTRVRSACVKDRGRPGKGRKTLPTPRQGGLHPYKLDLPTSERHRILRSLIRKQGYIKIIRKISLLCNITATGSREKGKVCRDKEYVERQGRSRSRYYRGGSSCGYVEYKSSGAKGHDDFKPTATCKRFKSSCSRRRRSSSKRYRSTKKRRSRRRSGSRRSRRRRLKGRYSKKHDSFKDDLRVTLSG